MSAQRETLGRGAAVAVLLLTGLVLYLTGTFTGLDFASVKHGFTSDVSPMLRYARTVLCAALAFLAGTAPLGSRDRVLTRLAFSLVVVADFFVILHPEKMLIGMGVFMLVHLTLAVRHAQGWRASLAPDSRAHTLRWLVVSGLIIGVPGTALLVVAAPMLQKSGLFAVDVAYLAVLMLSAWMAWGTLVRPFFPRFNARIIAVGMTFFFVCDISLGLSHALTGKAGQLLGLIPDLSYSWALLALGLSAASWDRSPAQ